MSKSSPSPLHPGQHVRQSILAPKKISVTEAAKTLGVGRPALSNFLNGKAAATAAMASRIERAFGISARSILDMQGAYDAARVCKEGAAASVKTYVPPFLQIKARDVEDWVSTNTPARHRLPVLLRILVNSTGLGLTRVDFPGNDDAQRPGWDGFIEATQGTPWIPAGPSGWEFGTDKDVRGKAEGDFKKRVNAMPKAEREQLTFVFVTPRRWSSKKEWAENCKTKGHWKDVRAYDASDVEQWLEQSIPGQVWFANETNRCSRGVRSLDKSWSDWANVADPPLSGALFAPAIDREKRKIESHLSKPAEAPILIAADSTGEALAFLCQLFDKAGGDLAVHRDRILVFDEPGALAQLAGGGPSFIAVATNRRVEQELAQFVRSIHSIVLCPRNTANAEPDIILEPMNCEAFRSALEATGYGRDEIERLSNESGRSLTVLRRRLSRVPAVRTPAWAEGNEIAARLIPFMLAGAWSAANETDQTTLTLLAGEDSYETLERQFQRLASLEDAPVWSAGDYRGVVSKIDILFAIASHITTQDLERYIDIARNVLSEDDPRLDLPESERWAAPIHGRSREFSGALRKGISETLVLLALHGDRLFGGRLGIDVDAEVTRLVRQLLTPLTLRTLEASDRDLPTYAEAAPREFLSILEEDLRSPEPASVGLMRPAAPDPLFGGCVRTGLLWALESLAWDPATFPRVVLILGRFAEIEIDDNWANKPITSLQSIFRAWMPQTAADHSQRLAAMRQLAERHPTVAWKICVDQFRVVPGVGDYTHKPRWRTDAHGFGEPFKTREPVIEFTRKMVDMALGWGHHTREMLGELVERLQDSDEEYQAAVWRLIEEWATADASDRDKAWLREKIRVSVLSGRAARRSEGRAAASLTTSAKAVYRSLEPADVFSKYEWLFRDTWVEESADEVHDEVMDYRNREGRIASLRTDALREIVAKRGWPAVIEFAGLGRAALQVGRLMVSELLEEARVPEFLVAALPPAPPEESWVRANLVYGALSALQRDEQRVRVLRRTNRKLAAVDQPRLLALAPFCRSTWQMVDELPVEHRRTYWEEVEPGRFNLADDDPDEAVRRLLAAQRPRAAFSCVFHKLDTLKPRLLFRMMSDMIGGDGEDKPGQHQLDSYDIREAFSVLDRSTEFTVEDKARLEFAYIDVLAMSGQREGDGLPNVERYLETHPEFFVQAVVWTYRRNDGSEDPHEWKVAPEEAQHLAQKGYRLLEGIHRIPGRDEQGHLRTEELAAWVATVRSGCAQLARRAVGDTCLGRLFSAAPEGMDGVWPCEPVRDVIEDLQSFEICRGASIGLLNARGGHMRGEGGDEERMFAEKYRAWARALEYSHPFVSSTLLAEMVRTYEHEATREDWEARVERRLR